MGDPFDTFERDVRAAMRTRRRRRWRTVLALGGAVLALGGAATAAAVVVRDEPSKPLQAPLPNSGGLDYRAALRPDLTAGNVGWCATIVIRSGRQPRTGGNGCGPAASPERAMIIGLGMIGGRQGISVLVLDERAATVMVGNRRIAARPDPALPAGWKLVVYTITGPEPPQPVVLDAQGRELPTEDPRRSWAGGQHRYSVHTVNPADPPDAPCAIRAGKLSGLRAVSAKLLTRFPDTPPIAKAPAFLSCATTVFYMGRTRLRVAMLVNAFDHTQQAAPLPENFQLSSRREGQGWLAVFGGSAQQRKQLLSVLHVNTP